MRTATAAASTAVERAEPQMRAVVGCDLGKLELLDLAEPERLGDRDRAVAELRLGRQQLDLDGAAEQRA